MHYLLRPLKIADTDISNPDTSGVINTTLPPSPYPKMPYPTLPFIGGRLGELMRNHPLATTIALHAAPPLMIVGSLELSGIGPKARIQFFRMRNLLKKKKQKQKQKQGD